MQNMPFVIYADFESMLKPVNTHDCRTETNTMILQQHVPAAFVFYNVCSYDSSLNRYVSYRGLDCVEKFLEYLQRDVIHITTVFNSPVPMMFTDNDKEKFLKAKLCFLCNNILFDDKVRDHCHFTGLYRGAAHSYCNIKFRIPFVPVFFHNLSGDDSHLFIRHLGEMSGTIKVIAKSKEKYISFKKFFNVDVNDCLPVRFVDSLNFFGNKFRKTSCRLK